jgi:hypothetical protein
MLLFCDTRIDLFLYFIKNDCCNHVRVYKNSLPEEQLPSLHCKKCNITVDAEDGIVGAVLLSTCTRRPS